MSSAYYGEMADQAAPTPAPSPDPVDRQAPVLCPRHNAPESHANAIRQRAYLLVAGEQGDAAATCICGCGVLWHFAPDDPCCGKCDEYRWARYLHDAGEVTALRTRASWLSDNLRHLTEPTP